jgi:hypothetical protein
MEKTVHSIDYKVTTEMLEYLKVLGKLEGIFRVCFIVLTYLIKVVLMCFLFIKLASDIFVNHRGSRLAMKLFSSVQFHSQTFKIFSRLHRLYSTVKEYVELFIDFPCIGASVWYRIRSFVIITHFCENVSYCLLLHWFKKVFQLL